MKNISSNPLPWLIGTLLALGGVAIDRLGPDLIGGSPRLVMLAGRIIAIIGLGVIMHGIRKRIQRDETASPDA